MASGGNLRLAGTGITPKAKTAMALWGIMTPEGPYCFQKTSANSLDRVANRLRGLFRRDASQIILQSGQVLRRIR
ncbi:hypothetical protein CLG94_08765 [Candidatus Methylomirabilis limnetica]|uniref:Uncharacterized protein n=1 Tax=Candidatus Methylomirabilis limnetica TaxID=2033718 RepID=A0A2T4TXH7_9BACT|nr:hypothetical protein [Candidatus Methylomirabilis limnetica]PTL35834.1 hypothetical protein CLG94_08765 [Candidatus Methylomirabilis limnetica]